MKKTVQKANYGINHQFQTLMDNWEVDLVLLQFGIQ